MSQPPRVLVIACRLVCAQGHHHVHHPSAWTDDLDRFANDCADSYCEDCAGPIVAVALFSGYNQPSALKKLWPKRLPDGTDPEEREQYLRRIELPIVRHPNSRHRD